MPTDRNAARYAVALQSYAVRDAIWMALDDDRLQGIELWVNLARRVPSPYNAAPLFLAALSRGIDPRTLPKLRVPKGGPEPTSIE